MAEAERVAELVGGDFRQVTAVPTRALRPAIVERDLADADALEVDAVDGAHLRRSAKAADREHAAAADRVGDLVERIVEDDAVAAVAAGEASGRGERAGVGE